MVRGDVDPIIDDVHLDGPVLVCRPRNRRAISGIEILHEHVVTEGRIRQCRRPRFHQKTVRMQVRGVEGQIGLARVLGVRHLDGIQRRQLIHKPDFKRVALVQRQPGSAIGRKRCRPRRTLNAMRG